MMMKRAVNVLRRIAAWTLGLLMLLSQLGLPAYALTDQEMATMPTVTVYYQTVQDGNMAAMMATPTSDLQGKAYWVTLPVEAFSFPVTLSVLANPATSYTFTPPDGTTVTANTNTVDYTGQSTTITAYQDGVAVDTYRLYVSMGQIPAEVAPASVPVYYVDADNPGNVLYSETFTAYYNTDNVVVADPSRVPNGYTLEGNDGVFITVGDNGVANPASVTFTFRKAQTPVQGTFYVYYTDVGGNELASAQMFTLDPGQYPISPDFNHVPQGYTLSDTSPAQVTVTIAEDGTVTPEAVTFEFAEAVTEQPTEEPTQEPVTEEPTQESTVKPTEEPTQEPAATTEPVITPVNRYAQTIKAANFRTETSTDSAKAFADVPADTYLWVYGTLDVANSKGEMVTWASIRYKGTDCYVWSSLINFLSQEDSDSYNYAQPSPVPGTETTPPPATPTPTPTPATPTPTPEVTSTAVPAQVTGYFITVSDAPLAAGPGSDTLLSTLPTNTTVYVEGQNYLDNVAWHKVTVNGVAGYIRADYLRVMTAEEIDAYLATPEPTEEPTAEPTASPTETPVVTVTATPTATVTVTVTATTTETAITTVTATPTVTVTATPKLDMYVGYALTNTKTSIRDDASLSDSSIIVTLPADTLLYLNGQTTVDGVVWSGAQTRLGTSYIGLVQDAAVTHITDQQAQVYIDAYQNAHATPTPTLTPTPSPTPAQLSGYYLTLGDVPMRVVTSMYANVSLWLAEDTVVYVTGQVYNEGYGWHITQYGSNMGYVRSDQLRKLSDAEVTAYLKSVATATPTPAATVKAYDPYADSSYGYVNVSTVNFRATPSTNATKLKTLKKYAFALILGSKVVNGTTWYNLNQAGTIGWVDGSYFTVLNLTELSSFLNSSEYLTGLTNNSSSSSSSSSSTTTSSTSTGSASQGQVSSVEDWNVGVWQNPSSSLNTTYEPFNPYATPTAAPSASETVTPTPTPTFVVGTMIPIAYDDESKETQTSNSWLGLAIGGLVLLGGAGGVYAYALNQNKKRRLAARNAANNRRTQAQGGSAGSTASTPDNPYARRAAAAPPIAGTTQRRNDRETGPGSTTTSAQNTPYGKSGVTPPTTTNPYARTSGAANPYARPAQDASPYARPTGSAANPYAKPAGAVKASEDLGLGNQSAPAEQGGGTVSPYTGATPRSGTSTPNAGSVPGAGTTSPYASPAKAPDPFATSSPANPYGSEADDSTGTSQINPTPRRSSRASRYQNHDQNTDE